MATRSGRKPGPKKKTQGRTSNKGRKNNKGNEFSSEIQNEIILIVILAFAILLFLCNFSLVGSFGILIRSIMFGIFGLTAYILPVLIFIAVAFALSNRGNHVASLKLIAGVILFLLIGVICELFSGSMGTADSTYNIAEIYKKSSSSLNGGGVICGSIAYAMVHFLDVVGTILVITVLGIVCAVIITERSFLGSVKKGSQRVYESAREDVARKRKTAIKRQEEREIRREMEEQERLLRMDNKVTGVMIDTTLDKKQDHKKQKEDMHEIIIPTEENSEITIEEKKDRNEDIFDFEKIHISGIHLERESEVEPVVNMSHAIKSPDLQITVQKELLPIEKADFYPIEEQIQEVLPTEPQKTKYMEREGKSSIGIDSNNDPNKATLDLQKEGSNIVDDIHRMEKKIPKKYIFPPISLLKQGQHKTGDSTKLLKETAMRLQQTLHTFGVKVTITDISQGPSVTRYELQPQQGVKVSKIVSLTDDIKLNLAATDIRIEAPIPGKAAIGIEVPNKENSMVALRDLLESTEFNSFQSKIAFAVGKDIGGQTIVSDIAKMPHMLIAGSTGSGKSVCINTLIMSILYKAHPDDVKMIMVDPKVVELSVYNGIPHLLIPVVTDPKKAAAALHWGVAEMTDRYKKFADYNVRDLKGYNKMVENKMKKGEAEVPSKMPQIVIIVDELADLMMVAPGEVEESICRLAQLARAAGIHLIIATQRPSVDVITGLIKANMPSRVAFAVSSGVDSRTILDMNGAEKLLGKGDMLFYPQGYAKPARIQGAFVSDKEVSDVVDYLKNQAIGNVYSEDIEEKIASIDSSVTNGMGSGPSEERDVHFIEAGKFIIEKEKASIGMLQRVFKIGFNRAARIMDQLSDAGVVGEEEGTKPRKVLMSLEQFESYIEESV